MNIKIGDHVTYVDGKAHTKLAIVTGTPESVSAGSSLRVPEPGFLHLAVLSPGSAHLQPKLMVPGEAVLKDLLADAEQTLATYEAEHPQGSEGSEGSDWTDDEDGASVDESADYKARAVLNAHRNDAGESLRYWAEIA